jgi:hypothetical protein
VLKTAGTMAAGIFHINHNKHRRRLLSALTLLLGLRAIFCPVVNAGTNHEPSDFDGDGHPDLLLYNSITHRTGIWYLKNTKLKSALYGPSLPSDWQIAGVADFDGDGQPDFAVFNAITRQTGIWYLSGPSLVRGAYGPSLPGGWDLVAVGDFNKDGKPDYVLFNTGTGQSAIWYLNDNDYVNGVFGPTLPPGWSLAGVADFNGDRKLDYLLFNASTRYSAIWYLAGATFSSSAYAPTIASGYALAGTADFNRDAKPDYLLYDPNSRQTAIWYLNGDLLTGAAYGPTLPTNWSLSSSSTGDTPRGVFSLGGAGRRTDPAALSNPAVAGISLRLHWADLEPSEGVYNWHYFDNEIARAQAAGKKVLLRVGTGADNIPSWVKTAVRNAGGRTFSFSDDEGAHTIPVFWDPTFLSKKIAMIVALGRHYSGNPAVQGVGASFANASSDDWSVPHNNVPDAGYSTSEVTRWRSAGYTSARLITAGNYVIDATLHAFPNQVAVLAINSNGNALDAPNDASYVARTVITSARSRWGAKRLVVAKNSLSAGTTPAPPPRGTSADLWYSSRPAIGAQALWFSYGDLTYRNNRGLPCAPATALQRMVAVSRSYGVSYLELYETDVVNLPSVVLYAHNLLW